jgi:hypothetical protein
MKPQTNTDKHRKNEAAERTESTEQRNFFNALSVFYSGNNQSNQSNPWLKGNKV